MTRLIAALALGVTVSACASGDLRAREARAELARERAFACWMDVDVVPLERSGNCVSALKAMHAELRAEPCEDRFLGRCRAVDKNWVDAHTLFADAVGISLWRHGKPSPEVLSFAQAPTHPELREVYKRPEVLEKMFEYCLRMESGLERSAFASPNDALFIRTTTIHHPQLEDGQLCYREDYQSRDLA